MAALGCGFNRGKADARITGLGHEAALQILLIDLEELQSVGSCL